MKYLSLLTIFIAIIALSSCRNDFESVASSGNLEFSLDTVYLDTIFSNIGSSTYNLKVYNRSNEDVTIPTVRLGEGENSNYRLNVDGLAGKTFENIQVLAKDSIFIFVETTFDIASQTSDNQFIYTDQIQFDSGGNQQNVELVTLVQDAVFLFPDDLGNGMFETLNLGMDGNGDDVLISGFVLEPDELTFTNEKPYVIYGYAAVPDGATLTVEAGARVHFHADSGILVANNGQMIVNGAPSTDPELLENEVIFEGDRLEPAFADVPGQWGTIWLTSGSTDHEFNYTTIKNGVVGILADGNDGANPLELNNVQIYNNANAGLLARNAFVIGNNMVINNSGQTSLACSLGGSYEFNHSTFANYWTNSFRSFPAVQIDNGIPDVAMANLIKADFNNCIIYGNELREIGLFPVDDDSFEFSFNFNNSLIRFEDPNGDFTDDPNYPLFSGTTRYTNSVLSVDPVFQNTNLNNFNIELGTSGAEGIGQGGIGPTNDLNGTVRNATAPDAGAYEATEFPDGD